MDVNVNAFFDSRTLACESTNHRAGSQLKIRSLACSEAELLHEDVLDLLQPVQAVLTLEAHLGPLRMVPNDSPYPKIWV